MEAEGLFRGIPRCHEQIERRKRKADSDCVDQADRNAAHQAFRNRMRFNSEQASKLCRDHRNREDDVDEKHKKKPDRNV